MAQTSEDLVTMYNSDFLFTYLAVTTALRGLQGIHQLGAISRMLPYSPYMSRKEAKTYTLTI